MNTTSSARSPAAAGQDAGQQERRGDHDGQGDRAPAHGEIAEQLGIRVEVEEDDGDRHGGDECIEGSAVGSAADGATTSSRT